MARKQMKIPGTERVKLAEVDTAAENYVDVRDERMELTKKENETKDALIAAMKKHGVQIYKDESTSPPLVVVLTPGEDNVTVKREKADKDGDPLASVVGSREAARLRHKEGARAE